jgi:hypothetical protein
MEAENLNEPKKPALQQGDVMPSLRDYIACEAMKAKIMVWDTELTNKHRQALLKDMVERYGNVTVNDALSMMCYEIADSMIKARSNGA